MTRILVVDQDTLTRALIADILATDGYTVEEMPLVEARIERIAAARPQLIVIDLSPVCLQPSIAILNQIVQHPDLHTTGMLLMTTDPYVLRQQERLIAQRGYRSILKPFSIDDLLGKVRAARLSLSPTHDELEHSRCR